MSTAVTICPRKLMSPRMSRRRKRNAGHLLVANDFLHARHVDAVEVPAQIERAELSRLSVVIFHDDDLSGRIRNAESGANVE